MEYCYFYFTYLSEYFFHHCQPAPPPPDNSESILAGKWVKSLLCFMYAFIILFFLAYKFKDSLKNTDIHQKAHV